MNKKKIALSIILCSSLMVGTPAFAATPNLNSATRPPKAMSLERLSGKTRYETAKVISEYYKSEKVQNVILSTGNEFADALSASVLAHEKEAPILLVDTSVEKSKDTFDYILQHLDSSGTVYIIGGAGVISSEFENKLSNLGFKHIVRIAGHDRYATSYKIANSLQSNTISTVVISSGEQYPDALSISSFAAYEGWPILLAQRHELSQETVNFLLEKKPSKVFITGGVGAISDDVILKITDLLPQASIERLTGESRFDTNAIIAETFAPNPSTIYITTGYGFADALAGSVVAAKKGEPILFIDPSVPTLPKSVASYFGKLYANNVSPNIVSLGGSGVVADEVVKNSINLISGIEEETSIYSIADISAEVNQFEHYALPQNVQAKLYNSDTVNVLVKWNPLFVDTNKMGLSVFNGTVDGYPQPIKLSLNVKEPLPFAEYLTNFDSSQINRTENIRLAVKALDGKILAPGEQFSFNDVVGERTAEAGYKEAIIIEGDSFTPGLGGGVCQVSSTLYNTVRAAKLEVIERHSHSLPITYVPPGQDATVAFPVLDFKFKNTSEDYLLIHSYIEGNTLTIQFYKKPIL